MTQGPRSDRSSSHLGPKAADPGELPLGGGADAGDAARGSPAASALPVASTPTCAAGWMIGNPMLSPSASAR